MRKRSGEPQEEVRASGGQAVVLSGDLGNTDVPAKLLDAEVSEVGGFDVLLTNAGIAGPGSLSGLSVAEWDRMFAVNLRGAWLLAKSCYPWRFLEVDPKPYSGTSKLPTYEAGRGSTQRESRSCRGNRWNFYLSPLFPESSAV